MTSPDLSVIIPTFRRKGALFKCLESIWTSDLANLSCEIIVIDDGSGDDSTDSVEAVFPGVRLVRNVESRLPCRVLSQGLSLATGRYAVRVDDDNVLAPETLRRLYETIDSNRRVAFCGAAGYRPNSATRTNWGTRITRALTLFKPVALQGAGPTHSALISVDLVDNVYIFRPDLVRAVGGFACCELFPWSLEDALPQIALHRRGFRIVVDPEARVTHDTGERSLNSLQWLHLMRSRVVFLRAVNSDSRLLSLGKIAMVLPFHLLRAVKDSKQGGELIRGLIAMIRGALAGLKLPPAALNSCRTYIGGAMSMRRNTACPDS